MEGSGAGSEASSHGRRAPGGREERGEGERGRRRKKKGRRKKMTWGPYVSKWREERQQGYFGLYDNIEACKWIQEH